MKDTWAHHGLSESTHEYPEKTQPEAQAASTPANLATHVTPAQTEKNSHTWWAQNLYQERYPDIETHVEGNRSGRA